MSEISLTDLYGNRLHDRRRRLDKPRTFDPKSLQEHNHEILNMHSLGMKPHQIAKALGVTTATVGNTINSTLGQEKLRLMRGNADQKVLAVKERVDEMAEKALDKLEAILDDEDERASLSLQRTVAMNILVDLGGYGAPKQLDIRSQSMIVTPEFLQELKERGRKAAEDVGMVKEG